MTIWFDAIALAAGVPAAPDHRPAQRTPVKARRAGPARRFARDILTDIGGAVPLRALDGLRRWHKRRKAIAELSTLDDRTLRDIGVSRGSIRELVDAQLRFEAAAVAVERRPAPVRAGFGARPCAQPC
ncbi:MAG: DUF1127 domain-containing protein [Proteobacteria bacterium]|nr:DUF1127 domain-containing protein [Pseudomonadota bacterium]